MQRIEAIDEYNRAQRLGMRDYREKTAAGKYPYLPALDELLEKTDTESQIPLGTIEIPLDYVVGTKTTGRTMAFASNFMPRLIMPTAAIKCAPPRRMLCCCCSACISWMS